MSETRKKIEIQADNLSLNDFYVCSMSSKSIIYKGMFLAELAYNNPEAFKSVVKKVQSSLS